MWIAVALLVLAVSGLGYLYLCALRRADALAAERDALRARLQERDEDRARLGEAFEALSARALARSSEEFLKLAGEHLEARRVQAAADLDRRRAAIDQLVAPIAQALQRTEAHLGQFQAGQAGIAARIRDMLDANQALRAETGRLTQALRRPNVRGRWGEVQLERVVELSGMRRWCDFTPQLGVRDDDGRLLKPDVVVKLPSGRVVAVDAKTAIDAYLDAVDEPDAARREALLDRHAANVADQIARLGRKEYWAQLESLEIVVMFVPGDQLIDAALERRPELVQAAAERNVVLASPSTLIGLLRAIHVGWRETELSESAEELFRLGRELHERAAVVLERAAQVGEALDQAKRRYNAFVGSVDTRLVPTLRKFEERGARSARKLAPLREIEGEARRLQSLDDPDALVPAPRVVRAPEEEPDARPPIKKAE